MIEPKLRKRLGRGRVTIDGTLDLHGMRQDEAYGALTRYLSARSARGDRTILVITGKGLKKVNGDPTTIVERGVLRTMLPIWLSSPDLLAAGRRLGPVGPGAWRRGRLVCAAAPAGAAMTPLGAKMRELREARGITLKEMAKALNVSSAYLSALEHGKRGRPTWGMLQRIIHYFQVIWDEAEELQRLAETERSARDDRHRRPRAGSDGTGQPAGARHPPAGARGSGGAEVRADQAGEVARPLYIRQRKLYI